MVEIRPQALLEHAPDKKAAACAITGMLVEPDERLCLFR